MAKKEIKNITRLRMKAKIFKGMADVTRLSIFEALRHGEKTVTELVDLTDATQSNISNHLSCLKECGLLGYRKEGKNIYYFIADKKIEQLLDASNNLVVESVKKLQKCMMY